MNDPDVFFLRNNNLKFTQEQKLLLARINNLCGNVLFVSDNAGDYDEKQLELLKKFGYKKCDDVSGYISQLKRRMSGEGLIVNEAPDDDALEQCKKLGSDAANA